ncbi:MAG: outer membrane protein transport protein [Bacteroidaceae bacterium]|nr:outer membrane protein transport protein [Bacteroidaceae bacterium]
MKKVLVAFAIFSFQLSAFNTALAGGLVTNSNQNVSFLRQMSQDGIIDITGLYLNPAGTAFLSDGWHVSASWQNAKQSRDIVTEFPLFQYNQQQPYTPHKFEGDAYAPVLPSFQLSYNHDRWSLNANFALNGGGGKCEFDQGLGSFEALYSGTILSGVSQAGMLPYFQGYSLDAYMKGRQYHFGLTLGSTYKFRENLAGFVGLRAIYATCNYNGYVQDVKYTVAGNTIPANSDLALNCDQTAFGFTPILGLDYRINKHWNVAAKYEFETRLRLKNKTEMNDFGKAQVAQGNTTLAQFEDGKKVEANIPGILNAGVMYSPTDEVRLMAGWHYYFDKAAKQYGDKQKLIDKNTQEFSAGVEYDVCKWLTLSASWQNTRYGLGDEYMNDLSFNCSNNMLGGGVRIHPSQRFSIDVGYMHTFYRDKTVSTLTAAGMKTDTYSRKNRVLGIGVNVDF